MDCEEIRPALMNYLLEEVSVEEGGRIERHLEQCAACSEEAGRFRETLAQVRQAESMEEIPQRIRLVAEPAGRWHAFWLNPARLAFAGFGVACLAVALLAVSRATLSIGDGGMHIAFDASRATPAANTPVLPVAAAQGASQVSATSRTEVLQLIAEAVAASEAKQQSNTKQLIETVSQQNEQQRMRDWSELTESLRPIEAAQVTIWKQQVQSDQYVSALMQQAGMHTSAQ